MRIFYGKFPSHEDQRATCDFSTVFSTKAKTKKKRRKLSVRLAIPQIANGTKR